ncbi:MAG: CPBP family intramembrane metalloprotease [Anaerolineales bacterium]|nr:CPBP family intramembrane metalloprotease [Anaerolineales bacterium]
MKWSDPRSLQLFGIFLILCLWLYFFIYAWRHKLPIPWGMSFVLVGILVTGFGITYRPDNLIIFSLQPKLVVCLVGLVLNIANLKEQFRLRNVTEFLHYIGIGMVAGLVLTFVSLLAQLPDKDYLTAFNYTKFAIVTLYLQTSIAEEILFRGWFLSYLRKSNIGFFSANFIQSAIFAILHITVFYDNWGQMFSIFLLGFIGGYMTWKHNNIISATVLHVVFNLAIILVSAVLS